MKLCKLLSGINFQCFGNKKTKVDYLTFNSKLCERKSLFFCLNGTKTNGFMYIDEAIKNGAVAIVLNDENLKKYLSLKDKNIGRYDRVKIRNNYKKIKIDNSKQNINSNVSFIVVKNVRKEMSKISAKFYGNPQNKLKIIGITGTNGKTSCSYLIATLLKSFGKKVGVIGTNGVFIGNKKFDAHMTTPDSIELFKIFAKMVKAKVEYCIMEVSAHAIYLNKVYGINFAVKCLTNVKSDHLDFFKSQPNYENTKMNFFNIQDVAVVNYDDKTGKKLAKKYKNYSFFGKKSKNSQIINKNLGLGNTNFVLRIEGVNYFIKTGLTGEFNIYNITLSICVLLKLGFKLEEVFDKVKYINNVDGRFDVVYKSDDFNIVIDYAHTTDSLKNLLKTITAVSRSKNIIVFGCPGERDTTKRFLMGKLAGKFCEYIILTTDNPASENSKRIMFEIGEGVKRSNKQNRYFYIENRQKAIKKAIKIAKKVKKCNILIVGKGIENYQIIGDKFKKYSDYDIVKILLKNPV